MPTAPHAAQTSAPSCRACWPANDYNLDATLDCGQAFRWEQRDGAWTGIVGHRWVRLSSNGGVLTAETAQAQRDWTWMEEYLQLGLDLQMVLATFPPDPPLQQAVAACRGLRLLRQDPWECLASFLLSSTKQIVQIRDVIRRLCEGHGEPIVVPPDEPTGFAFPTASRLAVLCETDLRQCRMGFRAPHLLAAARAAAEGALDLPQLARLPLAEARGRLMQLRGVGPKIADCVLLFGCGHARAFPIDVWVERALREICFPKRRVSARVLREFADRHFGPHAGYAQQYLFHHIRTLRGALG
jgi:N-glycosylase/DNA lyase